MTDYKQLCGKLADELGKYHARVIEDDGYGSHDTEALLRLADKALAEPEPEGPTVMEIIELADEIEKSGLGQADLVRAALARWGNNTTRSI